MYKTYKIYKPYGVLSQFTKEHESHITLGDLYEFPKDVYPIGRLDKDSEGLLLLSNNKALVDRILNPRSKKSKTYWVQVEGEPEEGNMRELSAGVKIKIKTGKYHVCAPCEAKIIEEPPLPKRDPPVRFRKNSPTTWLAISITEGKNRQVRKMCAKVGFPVLRLVRHAIGDITIDNFQSGQVELISTP